MCHQVQPGRVLSKRGNTAASSTSSEEICITETRGDIVLMRGCSDVSPLTRWSGQMHTVGEGPTHFYVSATPYTPFPEAFVWRMINPSLKWNHMTCMKMIYGGGLRLDRTEDTTQLITKCTASINMQMSEGHAEKCHFHWGFTEAFLCPGPHGTTIQIQPTSLSVILNPL